MSRKINFSTKIILILVLTLAYLGFLAPIVYAESITDVAGEIREVLEPFREVWFDDSSEVGPMPQEIIASVIKVFLTFLGVIFIVLMLYGGFLWMTASGNEDQVKKARALIQNAILGVIIVFAAYAITDFVLRGLMEAVGIDVERW